MIPISFWATARPHPFMVERFLLVGNHQTRAHPNAVDESSQLLPLFPPTVTGFVPGICSSITSAASRSALPLATNTSAPTISPLRSSTNRFPLYLNLYSLPSLLRANRASASVFDACLSFDRRPPLKFTAALPGSARPASHVP